MNKLVRIYTLSCPVTNEIRYIGITTQTLERRLYNHSYCKHNKHKINWFNKLKRLELTPIIEEIDICTIENASFWEQYYISQFRAWGFRLLNATNGGGSLLEYPEIIRKKISKALKGKKLTEEQKRKRKPRVSATEETKRKISESIKGRTLSDETKAKISAKSKLQDGSYLEKKVYQLDVHNNIVAEWSSVKTCALDLNMSKSTVGDIARGRSISRKGIILTYTPETYVHRIKAGTSVKVRHITTGIVYDSVMSLSKSLNINYKTLHKKIKNRFDIGLQYELLN